jgi:4'-phosphopantetheinyl transferase
MNHFPDLAAKDVHVWRVDLDLPPLHLARHRETLAPDEIQHAGQFHFERDRSRYITARGWLRILLAGYLHVTPTDILFYYSTNGKPGLAPSSVQPHLSFNVSHSEDTGLIAICQHYPIGVDIEYVRPEVEDEMLVQRFFAPTEIADYMSLPIPERQQAFYRGWTRKEAYLKARGDGLYLALNQFAVSLLPGQTPQLTHFDLEPTELARWTLMNLSIGPNYSAALAIEGRGWLVKMLHCAYDELGFMNIALGSA